MLAATYNARWSQYVATTTAMALSKVPPEAAGVLLDVGCGTGSLIERVLQRDARTLAIGIDLTRPMLEHAAERLGSRGRLLQGTAEALPFADASMNVVVSTSALHYLGDPTRALQEMRRVLVPGGILVVTDWCADYRTMRLLDIVLRLIDPAHGQTLTSSALVAAVANAGCVDVTYESVKIDRFWGIMTVIGRA